MKKYTNLLEYIGETELPKPLQNIDYIIRVVKRELSSALYDELPSEEANAKFDEMADKIENDLEIMAEDFLVTFKDYIQSIKLPTKD